MRILVTGASGMLGATLVSILEKEHTVYGTGNSNFNEQSKNYRTFNLASDSYEDLIMWSKPELIILSGALTNGNYCEEHPQEAFHINGFSVDKFIKSTTENVKIIYISTDAVFPSKINLAKESDCVCPENIYGKSKELGEFFTTNSNRDFCVLRTTIVGLNLNKKKTGFLEWIINSAKQSEKISLFEDVIFNPISIWDFIEEIKFIIALEKFPNKILHISGTELTTKYNFGLKLLQALNLDIKNLNKGSIKSLKKRAKRCNDQSLDCNYYQNYYERALPNLDDTIKSIKYYESN